MIYLRLFLCVFLAALCTDAIGASDTMTYPKPAEEEASDEEMGVLPAEANIPFNLILPIKYVAPLAGMLDSVSDSLTSGFQRACELYRQNRFEEALPLFTAESRSVGQLKDYALYYRMLVMLKMNNPIEAVESFINLENGSAPPFLVQRAALDLFAKNIPERPKDKIGLAGKALGKRNLPEFQYALAGFHLLIQDTASALGVYLTLLKGGERTIWADSAEDRYLTLAQGRFAPDNEARHDFCRYLEKRMEFDRLLFHALPASQKEGVFQERFLKMSFNAAFRTKQYVQAIKLLDRLSHFQGNDPFVLYKTAQCLERMKFYKAAFIKYRDYLQRYPSGDFGDNILWDAGRRMEGKKNYPEAIRYFRWIAAKYPRESFADKAAFRIGYCFYKNREYDSTLQAMADFLKSFKESSLAESAPFWMAKTWEAKNNVDSAAFWHAKTIEGNRYSFYAFRSEEILKAMKRDSLLIAMKPQQSVTAAEFYSMTETKRKSPKPGVPAGYRRGLMLIRCGLPLLALPELKESEGALSSDPQAYFRLLRLYEVNGFFYEAFRLSLRMMQRIKNADFARSPDELNKVFFPRYYGEAIDLECRKYGFDPLFIHSIIRQESTYDYKIVSPAGAIGLLQLMPATAAQVAKKMQLKFAPDSLFNPFYNLKVGIYHVIELMDRFNNSRELTLCAYNAGSAAASGWAQKNKDLEYDEFVEEIGYTETRNYVKKCMRNYFAYQELWGGN